jgi:hypothetical protein
MNERVKRDRPAKNPGGMQCEKCDEIFIGEEWHVLCAICVQSVVDELVKAGCRVVDRDAVQ